MLIFSGTLTTRTSLERLSQDEPHLVRVSAVDAGGYAGYTVVRVHVAVEPAAMPSFFMTEYRANVFANVPSGTSVVKVCACVRDLQFIFCRFDILIADGTHPPGMRGFSGA